ncbi:hypothetical protein NI454_12715 [Brevundimonas diminuta]|uniref:hypothetical protein n=1 Tax=Brevundimonas diminuta TaxID=293 RepID=UPI0020980662|nr:hypothetical protein [Brevundimonas diminuta]MCO8030809.1 hypothetical protein [Brevundimonas diminuta]
MTVVRSAGAAVVALAASTASWPVTAQEALVRNLVIAAEPQPFSADDLLWMEVRAGDTELADSMNVFVSRAGVFLPLGEFARVVDVAVGVFPAQRRAEGWVIEPSNRLVVDLARREATIAGRVIPIGVDQAAIYGDDLYVRADLLEQLLPVRLKADASAQTLDVTTTRPLPFEQRAERLRRQAALGAASDPDNAVRMDTPYRLASPPSFDVNIGGQLTRDGVDNTSRFDLRASGDLLHAGFEGYAGSDDDGEISTVRVMLTRKDPYGRALGPLGGTRAAVGDVYSPSMAIGPAGVSGRGVFYTSAPLESLDLATPLNLRGELALGEEVELYVNEVLQRAQTSPVQGRYEFLDVPLAFGLNTIRLVFYGSQGQIRETVRRINFGSGQLQPGRFVLRLGAVEQDRTVFDIGEPLTGSSSGSARVAVTADYGLSPGLTLSAGAARYQPQGREARSLTALGLRGSLGVFATQVDAAFDDNGGRGATGALATRLGGISLLGRHSEYTGGFIDETRQLGATDQAPLRRATDLRADGQWSAPNGLSVPVSLNARHLVRADGAELTNAEVRASAPLGRLYASTNIAYEAETGGDISRRRWLGGFDVTTLVSARIQTRAGLTYEVAPDAALDSAYITADWQISEAAALRLGAVRTLGPQRTTSLQASHLWRAPRFDLALNLAYETDRRDWRVGLQMGFGFGYDPGRGRYRMTRPGVAGGGSLAINAWVDENGDGVRQPGEPGVPGLIADTPAGAATTNAEGRAFATGLGDAPSALIRLNAEAVDDPFLVGRPAAIRIVPRPGRASQIDYPMQRSAEVQLQATLVQSDGVPRPIAALAILLVPRQGGEPVAGRSDHAGVVFFERLAPGVYDLQLDPDQARALSISLVDPVQVIVPAGGGFVEGGRFGVTIAGETLQ